MNARTVAVALMLAMSAALLSPPRGYAEQPPAPCHANPNAAADSAAVASRGDVVNLPQPLKDRLIQLADRPHSYLPMQTFAEADGPSQLFQYYLLDTTGFEPNVFTGILPGVNDHVQLTVTGGNCGLSTIGAVRVALEPKPGLPTDPNDPRAFNDVFTDISPLFVINNESGWYEGWMIHDITVPPVAPPRPGGRAAFGTVTAGDAEILKRMGTGNDLQRHATSRCPFLLGVQLSRDVPMPEVVLDRPRIVPLVRQLEPAGMPEHVGMGREAELRLPARPRHDLPAESVRGPRRSVVNP